MKTKRFNIWHKIGTIFSVLLLAAAVASTAAVNSGDATLESLMVGRSWNIVDDFSPSTYNYTYETEDETFISEPVILSAVPTASDAVVTFTVNGTVYTNHSITSLVSGENTIVCTVKSGSKTQSYTVTVTTPQVLREEYFTWKNATVYFVLTDRFYNGDTSNDESYHRHKTAGGSNVATFHGGDIKGLTEKLDYLDNLGVNAIWITAPYEQMHGWTGGKDDAFPHYAFHGYYTLDWTYMDRNMGTLDDMKTFVTEAHKRGIRVVMDIVLNHTGYATLDDCLDYGFGNIKGSASTGWVPSSNFSMWNTSNQAYFDSSSQGNWGNWWTGFVRAFGDTSWYQSAGFAASGNDDKTLSLAGLPDVVTEKTSSVNIPPFLQTKWSKENSGDYLNYRLPNVDTWRQSGKGAPADYIIEWLAAWVEYFGIDGFRCDTAKHVELSRWNQLKNRCKTALNTWRNSDRADEYAKNWDEDFWMTGEAWGWDHGDTGYFTSGGFDSMINFAFNGSEGGSGRTPNTGDWEYYANFCNGSSGKQVLNYVSSHDTGLHRPSDQKAVGTMLLLCPGGAQIYYGDETARPGVSSNDPGMVTRGDMNWSAQDNETNKHWQLIGQFRRRNPAVGAGTQTSLGTDTYGRKFSENGFSNAVVIRLNTSSGQSYTVNVSGYFADGERVMDGYNTSNSTTVSGGTVTLTASGPVLLIEPYGTITGGEVNPTPTPSKPTVTASPASGQTFTDNITVSLSVNPAGTTIYYTTDGTAPSTSSNVYTSSLTFTETTTLKTYVSGEGGTNTQTFIYTKSDTPTPTGYYVYLKNTSSWSSPKVWAWNDNENCTAAGAWPGDAMTLQSDGLWMWTAPDGKVPTQIIFSDNGNPQTADLTFQNSKTYDCSGNIVSGGGGSDDPVTTEYCAYLKNTSNWSNPKVWAWTDSENCTAAGTWPGDGMTLQSDGTYKWSAPSGKVPTYIIFSDNGNSQTADLTFVNGQIYDCSGNSVGQGSTSGGGSSSDTPVTSTSKTIYFNGGWSGTPYAYIYSESATTSSVSSIVPLATATEYAGAWPGKQMTASSDGWYTLSVDCPSNALIIFNTGTSGSERYPADQEPGISMSFSGNEGWYKLSTKTWTAQNPDGPQKPTISVSPNGGTLMGSATITINISSSPTSISGTFNGKSLSLSAGSNSITVSNYLTSDGATGTLSIEASNAVGTSTYSASFTRDDSTPAVTLTGDHRELAIYQIMVGSFQHGDGGASGYSDMWGPYNQTKNGNIRGIINALDHIASLGVNAIWLTPVFDSTNGTGGEKLQATGYFCTNYFKIDPKFGTDAEFRELVQKCHEKGMYILLDGVFGHHGGVTSASPNGKYIDSTTSNNFRGESPGNVSYPNSLDYFKEVATYWIENYEVDGWRLDQAYQVCQNGRNYWQDIRSAVESCCAKRKAAGKQWGTLGYMVGEDWGPANTINNGVYSQGGLKSAFDFDGKDNIISLGYGVASIEWTYSSPTTRGYSSNDVLPNLFLSNHDIKRVGDYITKDGNYYKQLMLRHAVLAAYSGPCTIYYGDEYGDDTRSVTSNADDNISRTSGHLDARNDNERQLKEYIGKAFKARAENPAMWRGTCEFKKDNASNCQVLAVTKTDSQTGNKVMIIFSTIDTTWSIGGSGTDLINGGSVSGSVSVKALVPAIIKLN